jgi:hypothetical protein
MKTIKEWEQSGLQLTPFLGAGDVVEPAFADWAVNIMPPAFWSERLIQVGEPASHVEGKATFATFYKDAGLWHFGGYCHRGRLIDLSAPTPV